MHQVFFNLEIKSPIDKLGRQLTPISSQSYYAPSTNSSLFAYLLLEQEPENILTPLDNCISEYWKLAVDTRIKLYSYFLIGALVAL